MGHESKWMKRLVTLCVFVLLLSACALDCGGDNKKRTGMDQWQERQDQWQGNAIRNYLLIYTQSCFCEPQTNEVTVSNGAIARVIVKDFQGNVIREAADTEFSQYRTIDGFFALLRDIDKTADELSVIYDAALGYPKQIDVDPYATRCDCRGQCSGVVDDEYGYRLSVMPTS